MYGLYTEASRWWSYGIVKLTSDGAIIAHCGCRLKGDLSHIGNKEEQQSHQIQ
jgi:hypothetical protein